MTAESEHLARTEYVGMIAPLYDLERVLIDLQRVADGRLVIVADEYEFLTRRARGLARACIRLAEGDA